MNNKKIVAGLLALSFVFGGSVLPSGVVSNVASVITAQADTVEGDCFSFDGSTLTLKGEVNKSKLKSKLTGFVESDVKTIVAESGTVLPEDSSYIFYAYNNCTSIDLSKADTSNVTNMRAMFEGCTKLSELDLSSFDTSKVTDMQNFVFRCSGLTTLDLSGFDTSNVKEISNMFNGCSNLTTLDISGFDTSKVTWMNSVFEDCSSLTTLDLSSFDTSKVEYMGSMFSGCANLKKLTLGENFKNIRCDAFLPNGDGWVNAKEPSIVVSGDGKYAFIENNGKNTYKRLPIEEETNPTYPTNIKADHSEQYHQIRFTWDKVENAEQYGIAVYLAGKWRVQAQDITDTTYTTPKNLTSGKTYKVAIAAKVNGKWYTSDAIKNAITVTVK